MADEISVRGIVIRRRDSGESDRRLTLLTEELGRVDVVAKGARKASSRFAAVSEPLSIGRFTYAPGRARNFLTQAIPEMTFRALREDYERLLFGLALAEGFDAATHEGQHDAESGFDILCGLLEEVARHPIPLVAYVWAQSMVLHWIGTEPTLHECVDTGEPRQTGLSWTSPAAGGLVSADAATSYGDRFQIAFEEIVALSRIRELPSPPAFLKRADLCAFALDAFWRHALDRQLPAQDALLQELRSQRLARGE